MLQRHGVDPVVAVHHFEIGTGGVFEPLVDAFAVAAVFLMDHADGVGILSGVCVCNLPGAVGGAVVDNDDLDAGRRQ